MTGPFGLLAIGLSFVVGFVLPTGTFTRGWQRMLAGAAIGFALGLTGGLLDYVFGTSW